MQENGKEKVMRIITKALGLKHEVSENASMETTAEWDSLGHLSMLTALDKEFSGKAASIQDLAKATSVKKILELLKREKLI